MVKKSPNLKPAAESLLEDIEKREALKPDYFYAAKKSSVLYARRLGLTDAEIEKLLGISLKPEDKSGAPK